MNALLLESMISISNLKLAYCCFFVVYTYLLASQSMAINAIHVLLTRSEIEEAVCLLD